MTAWATDPVTESQSLSFDYYDPETAAFNLYDADSTPFSAESDVWSIQLAQAETVEAMDAFRHKDAYLTGAGECVSLATLYAAALFIVARIPLKDIYLMATPLHSGKPDSRALSNASSGSMIGSPAA